MRIRLQFPGVPTGQPSFLPHRLWRRGGRVSRRPGGLWPPPSLLQQLLGSRGRWADTRSTTCYGVHARRKENGQAQGLWEAACLSRTRTPSTNLSPVGQAPGTRC